MKKIEIIWREVLFQAIEKQNRHFIQKELAAKFAFSTSTVFQALKAPRKMGAVRVGGREFVLEDPEKLLYHWASVRHFQKDIIWQTRLDLPVLAIEGRLPPEAVFAGYTAARQILTALPADYDKVYFYTPKLEPVKKRFAFQPDRANVIVLKTDPFIFHYGQVTTLAQTFVDLWNLSEWYAKEYTQALKEKINGLLS